MGGWNKSLVCCECLGITTVCGEPEKRAAVAVYPNIYTFEKGVSGWNQKPLIYGRHLFTANSAGNVEIAGTVDKDAFYAILSTTLNGAPSPRHWVFPLSACLSL